MSAIAHLTTGLQAVSLRSAGRAQPARLGSVHAFGGPSLVAMRPEAARPARTAVQVEARAGGRRRGGRRQEEKEERFEERVVQVGRVTKVVKGGKQLSFRAVVIVGNEKGTVGVGVASAKEVVVAVQKAVVDAKRSLVTLPITKQGSIPHRINGRAGAAKVMLRPASAGTGVIAGGATRVVLELAGVKNIFGKQLGSSAPLNNARATVDGLRNLRTYQMVAEERQVPVSHLLE